jgi:hypothetical protein
MSGESRSKIIRFECAQLHPSPPIIGIRQLPLPTALQLKWKRLNGSDSAAERELMQTCLHHPETQTLRTKRRKDLEPIQNEHVSGHDHVFFLEYAQHRRNKIARIVLIDQSDVRLRLRIDIEPTNVGKTAVVDARRAPVDSPSTASARRKATFACSAAMARPISVSDCRGQNAG